MSNLLTSVPPWSVADIQVSYIGQAQVFNLCVLLIYRYLVFDRLMCSAIVCC